MKLPSIPANSLPTDPQRIAAFKAYAQLLKTYPGAIRGRETHVELIAIGAAESLLDNMAVGRNDLNGTPEGRTITAGGTIIDLHYSLAFGWLQHDSGWLLADTLVNKVPWTIEGIRSDPKVSLDLLVQRPGFILHQGITRTYIDFKKWAVWPKKSDAFLAEAIAAYDSV